MLVSAIILFSIAACLGLYLISFVLQNKATPKGLVFIHGPLAVLGLVTLIIYAILYKSIYWLSITIFFITAIGGIILILRDLIGKSIPKWLAILHGLSAILGLGLLIYFFVT